ncbi:amidase family protein [Sphingomonas alpina]|uniref:Twin-arginine translocation signal domain-containing protein n=1 Tax=Sphingomonas alpina TaxID=653931 RepID=A0A7H0LKK4_9SPHN|nr:amidase family protein [Sphingomonas alpina]QNQ10207.1 twin-arginine translocation signal domain-containing protein [Sphingomonas alpina]
MTISSSDASAQGRRDFLKTLGMASAAAALIPGSALARAVAEPAADFASMDATGLAAAIKARKISPLEAVNAAIARAQAVQPQLNCISQELYDRARKHVPAINPAGPFAGVPMMIKDEADVAGTAKHFGSKLDKLTPIAKENDQLVELIEQSGFNIFARTTMPEFGILPTTETLAYGITRNPWNLDHTPGGSSGGAAAAVAAGIIPLAHGSDGAGSLRIPGSVCGLVGMKPSRDRLAGPLSIINGKMDVSGFLGESFCLSRTVRDTANMLALLEMKGAGAVYPPVGKVTGPGTKKLRIGYIMNSLGDHVPVPEVAEGVNATLKLLESLGHHVSPVKYPFDGAAFVEDFTVVYLARANEAKKLLPPGTSLDPKILRALVEPLSFSMSQLAEDVPDAMAAKCYERIAAASKAYFGLFDTIDILVTPVLLKPPARIGDINGSLPVAVVMQRLNNYADYTMLQNATGGPALSLPMHWTKDGLPVGVQFAGPLGGDRALLELSFELEKAQPWAQRRPPLWAPSRV